MPDVLDAIRPKLIPQPHGGCLLPPSDAVAAMNRARAKKRTQPVAQLTEKPPENPIEPFVAKRVVRVRAQLNGIDDAIESALTPGSVDARTVEQLARASAALSDIERRLAGRPDPGSFRPEAPRTRKPKVEQVLGD